MVPASQLGSGINSSVAPAVVPLVKLQTALGVKGVAFAQLLLAGDPPPPGVVTLKRILLHIEFDRHGYSCK